MPSLLLPHRYPVANTVAVAFGGAMATSVEATVDTTIATITVVIFTSALG